MMHARPHEPHAETDAAIAEILDTFSERYPQSSILQQRAFPDSEEGVRAFLAEIAPRRHDAAVVEQIKDGSLVTAVLAGVYNRSVSELWAALQLLPLSYGEAALTEFELQDARGAIGSGAVLDPSSLSVLALLGKKVEHAVLGALPGSVVSQSTLTDADRGGSPVNDPSAAVGGVTRDARTGEPVAFEHDPTTAAELATRQRETLRIAQALHVEPDAVPDSQEDLERALLNKDKEVNPALRTWAATMTVAHRHGLPVLSDDRRVRGSMRASGVPSFGTMELLQVLAEAGDVAPELAAGARAMLLAHGAVGLHPSGAELATMARDLDWQPSAHIFVVLSDPTLWTPEPTVGWAACHSFLRTVWEEAPRELERWTARVIDAAKQAAPHVALELMCFGLLANAWGWTSEDGAADGVFLRALVGALRQLGSHLGERPRIDPVVYALTRFARVTARAPNAQRAFFALRAISVLDLDDQLWALANLWE